MRGRLRPLAQWPLHLQDVMPGLPWQQCGPASVAAEAEVTAHVSPCHRRSLQPWLRQPHATQPLQLLLLMHTPRQGA